MAPDFRQLLAGISIHAPREGSDPAQKDELLELLDFYPRSP